MNIIAKKKDLLWSYLGIITSICSNLVILPFVLTYLDDDHIGLYYIFISISGVSQLLDFGFSPSLSRNIAYVWSGATELKSSGVTTIVSRETNFCLLYNLLLFCKRLYLTLGLICAVLLLTVGNLYYFHITNYSLFSMDSISWYIYLLAIVLNIIFGYYLVLLRGVGEIEGINKAMVYSRLIQFVTTVLLLYSGFGLLGVSIAYLLYGLSYRIFSNTFLKKILLPSLMIDKSLNQKYSFNDIFKTLWGNTWKEGLVTLSEFMTNQFITVVASLYFTLYETGVLSFAMQVGTAIAIVSSTCFSTYQPEIQSLYVKKDKVRIKYLMCSGITSYFFVFISLSLLYLLIGNEIIHFIKSSYQISIPFLLIVLFYQFILKYRNCFTSYISSTNRLIYAKSFVVSSCLGIFFANVVLYFFNIGVYGLVCSLLLSQLCYNAWKWPSMVYNELDMTLYGVLLFGFDNFNQKIVNFVRKWR